MAEAIAMREPFPKFQNKLCANTVRSQHTILFSQIHKNSTCDTKFFLLVCCVFDFSYFHIHKSRCFLKLIPRFLLPFQGSSEPARFYFQQIYMNLSEAATKLAHFRLKLFLFRNRSNESCSGWVNSFEGYS